MAGTASTNPHIIGLTGSFGSGCTYVAKNLLANLGYRRISLSDLRRQERASKTGHGNGVPREGLQAFGDELRQSRGPDYLAKLAHEAIAQQSQSDASERWVIDSIRNPAEVHYLRRFSQNFFLFGIYANRELRWDRVRTGYNGNRRDFDHDDERDAGRDSPEHGQRVEDCFAEADVVLTNEEQFTAVGNERFHSLQGKIEGYVGHISAPLSRRQPTQMETLMAAAYTLSQRSSCLKRKVGAVLTDDEGSIISSGFNEVPRHSRPCADEFRECARTVRRQNFAKSFNEKFPQVEERAAILDLFRREFRLLDTCRALHAEENAIVNLARNGRSVPLDQCTLYTTTYPCRLCANKIVNLGISRVVYLEPYPDPVAKVILRDGGVKDEFFEGITFKAYFRVYGEKK